MGLGAKDVIWEVGYGDGDFLHIWVNNSDTKVGRLVAYKVSTALACYTFMNEYKVSDFIVCNTGLVA